MMQEILKPLLDSELLSEEVKTQIAESFTAELEKIISEKEEAIKEEAMQTAKTSLEEAKGKFEAAYTNLEASYKTKLEEAIKEAEAMKEELTAKEGELEDLKARPFVNVSEGDLEEAEEKLKTEIEAQYESAFDLAKEEFNATFEAVVEGHTTELATLVETIETLSAELEAKEAALEEVSAELEQAIANNDVETAVSEVREELEAKHAEEIAKLKENLVTATQIFLEQEMAEMKADYAEIMKETKGRELLESLKTVVKGFWDVDSEIVEELETLKKDTEMKVEQYRELLKKEHSRLEESEAKYDDLKKELIIEKKGSVLTKDKKEALTKLAEHLESEDLETSIDSLMESVISDFENSFTSKKEKEETVVVAKEEKLNESVVATQVANGDVNVDFDMSNILELAGITK